MPVVRGAGVAGSAGGPPARYRRGTPHRQAPGPARVARAEPREDCEPVTDRGDQSVASAEAMSSTNPKETDDHRRMGPTPNLAARE